MGLKLSKPFKRLPKVLRILLWMFLLLGGLYAYLIFRPFWEFGRIEHNAKKDVTPEALQMWATNLIAKYPEGGHVRLSELGTNLPIGWRDVAPRFGPSVYVNPGHGDDYPSSVRVFWGSGFMGHCGFEIGPTNFIGMGHAWSAGVYFWNDNQR